MKRFFQLLIIACILYFAFQGWQLFLKPKVQSDVKVSDEADKTTVSEGLNQVIGSLQENLKSLLTEPSTHTVPASIAQVTHSNEVVVNEIAANLQNRATAFMVDVYGDHEHIVSSMEGWIDEALSSDDYIRYALQSYTYSIVSNALYSEVSYEFKYRESGEQTDYVRRYIKDLFEENQVAALTDHEKIKWIHDWIVTHIQYDQSLTKYTAYEALTEQSAVCQGYALLGQMMLEEVGFEVKIAEGVVNTGNHAWNMVKLDNNWYHIDFTWDDPVGQAEDEVSYRYYLVSDETLKKDHSWTKQYPQATNDYRDVLRYAIASTSGEQRAELKQFQKAIHLHWYEDEYTIADVQSLVAKLSSHTKQKVQSISFRYIQTNTLMEDLAQAFKEINVNLSYSVKYYQFSDLGDSIVELTLTYK